MKKSVFILLLALLFLSGCSKGASAKDGAPDEIPELTVVCGEESVVAEKGTFTWTTPATDGTSGIVTVDTLHPLELEELLTPLTIQPSTKSSTDPRTAYLIFDGPLPNRLEVYRWVDTPDDLYTVQVKAKKTDLGIIDGESGTGYKIQLAEEYGVYEVCAQWGDGEREGGDVSFAFSAKMWNSNTQTIE